MINVWIDEFTPCLKDARTDRLVDTEVIKINHRTFLAEHNIKNGWHINWGELLKENEIYALVVKGSMDIQGLVALAPNKDYGCVYVTWMCAAPHNSKLFCEKPKYLGVGGHLFAIAAQRSKECGFDGVIMGFAANKKLLEHYCDVFNAEYIGILHNYQFIIGEDDAYNILEVYDYEWTDDER